MTILEYAVQNIPNWRSKTAATLLAEIQAYDRMQRVTTEEFLTKVFAIDNSQTVQDDIAEIYDLQPQLLDSVREVLNGGLYSTGQFLVSIIGNASHGNWNAATTTAVNQALQDCATRPLDRAADATEEAIPGSITEADIQAILDA